MSADLGGPYMHFAKGKAGSAGAYAHYILRPEAVLDYRDLSRDHLMSDLSPIWVRNLPAYVAQGVEDPGELQMRLGAFAEAMGQLERRRHQGRGHALEYFRATASFAPQIRPTAAMAQEIADDFLRSDFSRARVIASLHRNTGNFHINLLILARDQDGRKLDLGQRYFRMDQCWAKVYLRATQPDPAIRLQMFRLHMEKKYEMRRFPVEVRRLMEHAQKLGRSITRHEAEKLVGKPERFADYRNIPLHPHAKMAAGLARTHLRVREITRQILEAPESAGADALRAEYRSITSKAGGITRSRETLGELLQAYGDDPVFIAQVRRLAGRDVSDDVAVLFRERERELGGPQLPGKGLGRSR